jgi:hypothetical protein
MITIDLIRFDFISLCPIPERRGIPADFLMRRF